MEDISKRSIRATRYFDAPVDLLWKVLTIPEYMQDWWGPEGFTNTIRLMEVKQGGLLEFTMHGPDGTNYENEYVYREIIPLKKIVLEHLKTPKFTIAITLYDEGEKTRMEWQNIFETVPELKQAVEAFKADVGLEQNLNRLTSYTYNLKAKTTA
ncbi:MAG: SRPBCC domain-containing protein [Bacteroidota bacterium]|nr:SRPBCC domain-containing protein [Bacteroidota bacterium]